MATVAVPTRESRSPETLPWAEIVPPADRIVCSHMTAEPVALLAVLPASWLRHADLGERARRLIAIAHPTTARRCAPPSGALASALDATA